MQRLAEPAALLWPDDGSLRQPILFYRLQVGLGNLLRDTVELLTAALLATPLDISQRAQRCTSRLIAHIEQLAVERVMLWLWCIMAV